MDPENSDEVAHGVVCFSPAYADHLGGLVSCGSDRDTVAVWVDLTGALAPASGESKRAVIPHGSKIGCGYVAIFQFFVQS